MSHSIHLFELDAVSPDTPLQVRENLSRDAVEVSVPNETKTQPDENTGKKPVNKGGRPKAKKTKAQAEDEAAKKHGLGSRSSARRAGKVIEAIDDFTSQGDVETANELRSLLNNDSINMAADRLAEIEKAKEPEPKPEPVTVPKDANGRVLPERLREVFATRPLFENILKAIRKVTAEIKVMEAPEHEEETHKLNRQQCKNDIKNLTNQIKYSIPYAVCPYCNGSGHKNGGGCQACKGVGWVVKLSYDAAPEDMKHKPETAESCESVDATIGEYFG